MYRYRFEPPYFVEHALAIVYGLFFFNRSRSLFSAQSLKCHSLTFFFLLNCSLKTTLVTDFGNQRVSVRAFDIDFDLFSKKPQNSATPELYGRRPLALTAPIFNSSTRTLSIQFPSLQNIDFKRFCGHFHVRFSTQFFQGFEIGTKQSIFCPTQVY